MGSTVVERHVRELPAFEEEEREVANVEAPERYPLVLVLLVVVG